MIHQILCTGWLLFLTHWDRVTHIWVGNLTIIAPDNSLSPGRRQAIIWTNAGILLIGPWGKNFSEVLIGIQTFAFKKIAQWKHSYSTSWFTGNGWASTIHKYCDFYAAITCNVMDEECHSQCPKFKLQDIIYRNVVCFDTSPKMSHNFHEIHHCIFNLWICYVYLEIHYWHLA